MPIRRMKKVVYSKRKSISGLMKRMMPHIKWRIKAKSLTNVSIFLLITSSEKGSPITIRSMPLLRRRCSHIIGI